MTTNGRFKILTDENIAPKSLVSGPIKRAPFDALSSIQVLQRSSVNVLKPSNVNGNRTKADLEDAPKPCLKGNSYSVRKKETQTISTLPLHQTKCPGDPATGSKSLIDAPMISPLSIDSPMVISPAPQTQLPLPRTQLSEEKLLDDQFFTDIYGDSHYAHMREMELKLKPRADYMSRQRDISSEMRSVMIDWLVEVNDEYQLSDETLFLSIHLVDRFLSLMSVVRSKLQLVGTAAILVASKVEEIYPPQLSELVYITDDTYTASQIIRMEALLLKNLNFSIGCYHSLTFLRNMAMHAQISLKVSHMAQFVAELSLLDPKSLTFRPSEIAAASLLLGMDQVNGNTQAWTADLEAYACIDRSRLVEGATFLHSLLIASANSAHSAIPTKYSLIKYSSVSLLAMKKTAPELPL